jgi:hypothetical protein
MSFIGISMMVILFGLVGAVKFLSDFAVEKKRSI